MSSVLRIAQLPARGVVRVTGADARPFLHGLITSDVEKLSDKSALYSAFLTPQGKFLHDFFVVAVGDSILLECEAARAEDLASRLARFRLRADAALDDTSADHSVFAAFGGSAHAEFDLPAAAGAARAIGDAVVFVDPRIADLGVRVIAPSGTDPASIAPPAQPAATAEYDQWRLTFGVPDGSRDLEVEKSTLLEGNVDILNGVDWQKGCYLGQEVTARMHYRGLLKRRLVPFAVAGGVPVFGTPVTNSDGRRVGTIRSAIGENALALVEVAALDTGGLSAGDAALTLIRPAWAEFLAALNPDRQ